MLHSNAGNPFRLNMFSFTNQYNPTMSQSQTMRKKHFNPSGISVVKRVTMLLLLMILGVGAFAATYYSQGSLAANLTTSWNTNRAGGGSAPSNFTTAGDVFVIQGTGGGSSNHAMTTSSTWTIGTSTNNTKLQIEGGGSLTATSAVTIASAATFQLDAGSTYNHNHSGAFTAILGGTESFATTSNFVVMSAGGSAPSNGPSTANMTGSFGNFTYSGTSTMQCNALMPSVAGTLTVNPSTTGTLRLCASTAANTSMSISGDLVISNAGVFDFGNGSVVGYTVNLAGNLNVSSSSASPITFSGTGGVSGTPVSANFVFNKSGTQTFTSSSSTLFVATTTSFRQFNVTVNSGSTLEMGTQTLNSASSSTVNFTVSSGAGLITANTGGIASGNAASGSIQNLGGTRTFSTGANYTFNGTAAQNTGTGFVGANNLTINNSTGVSLSAAASVSGTLTLTSGKLSLGSNSLTMSGTSSTISGPSAFGTAFTNYIIANGTGSLIIQNIGTGGRTGAVLFPVGSNGTAYNPVSITNSGTADNFSVNVNVSTPGGLTAANTLSNTWVIAEGTAGGSDATIGLQWVSGREGASFDRTNCAVVGTDGSAIVGTPSYGGSSGTGPYTRSLSGVSSFSSYYGVYTPVAATAPTVTTTSASSITSTGASTGGNVTADGGATITERGVVYSTSNNPTTADTKVTATGTTGSFTSTLTGLTPGTTYYVRAYAINSVGTSYGSSVSFATLTTPTVTTTSASSVTSTAASSGGNVTSDGGATITERGVVYATTSNPTTSDTKVTATGTTGSFTSSLTGLTPGITYYVRAYAINSVGTSYGSEVSFATLSVSPSVTTSSISSITMTSASAGGNVSSDGGATITERGVVYATVASPTTADSKVTSSGTTGSFTLSLNGLTAGTTYYVRAYATNSVGTSYGSQQSFTTLNIPTVTTTAASAITNASAVSGGNVTADGGSSITERGVVYSTASGPTTADTKVIDGSATTGSFTSSITGLTTATTYYVRAYAINAQGTAYGSEESFTTTSSALVPTVNTAAVSNLGSSTVTVGGTVVTDGGDALTERGVVYSSSANPTTADTKIADGSATTGSFTAGLTGLTPGATYHVRAYAINSVGTAYGSDVTFTMNAVLPTVTTTAASSITSSSASSGGEVTADGGGAVTERGIVYGTTSNPTTSNTKVIDGSAGIGSFTSTLNGLTQATTYYVRAYAINSAGTAYGANESFTTLANAPTVTTASITNITGATATGGGNVTNDGGAAITERGIVISTSTAPTTADTKIADGAATTGSFTSSLTGLSPLTTYYVRAYATNSIGTSYGSEVSFTTISANPAVQASAVSFSNITVNGMTINFTAGDGTNSIVIVRSGSAVNGNPVNTTSYTANTTFGSGSQIGAGNYVVYNGTGNSVTITGLNPGTTYYVAVYSFNGASGTENYLTTSPATGNLTTANTDYRSVASGNWSSASTWEKYNGSSWVPSTDFPTSSIGSITIQAGHTVALDISITVDEMTIAASGQLTVNAAIILTVANGNGTDLTVTGYLKNQGTITLSSGPAITVAGTYEHAVAAGTIPACTWSTGSTCLVTGAIGTAAPSGTAQNFHHFTWNCTGQTGNMSLAFNNNTIGGNFTILSVGATTTSALRLTTASTAATNNIAINGNLVVNTGLLSTHGSSSGTSAITVAVGGNTTIASGATLDLNSGSTATTTSTWNLSGNFSNAGTLKTSVNASTSPLRFNNNATFTNTGTLTSGYLRVLSGVNLDFGTTLLNGGVSFTLDSAATMTTANTAAIIAATGTISLHAKANYVFNGASAQTLPASINAANNMTINNSAGVTLGAATAVTGTLTLASGKLSLGANNLTLSNAVAGAGTSNYIVTNGAGLLKFLAVGSTSVTYPIGNSAANYVPFTLTNNGTTSDIGVSVSSTITNAILNSAKAVGLQWTVNSSAATSAVNATFNWNAGDQGASFSNTGNGELGIYTGAGPYSKTSLGTLSGTSISKSGIALSTGNNLLVIGNANAITIAAQVATGFTASSVTCNAMNISWTPGANADGTIVLYTSGATAPNTNPSAGTTYTAGNTIGNATVAYVGSGSSISLSSLLENTNYNFKIYSYNGSGVDIAYLTTSILSGTQATAAIAAPTLAAASSISSTGFSTSWTSSTCANNYSLYVSYATPDTVAAWTWPTVGTSTYTDSTVSAGTPNYGNANFSLSGVTQLEYNGITTKAAGGTGWNAIGKYYQVIVNATGYANLTVSSSQQSSSSGPKDFQLEYKIGSGGTWTAVSGGTIVSGNGSFAYLSNVALPTACNNQSQVYLRWITTSLLRADQTTPGNTTASGGTNRIDDIYIKGNLINAVSGFYPATITGTSASVTGLSPLSTYSYYVTANGTNSTSAASNTSSVTTYIDPAIADFRTKASGNFSDAAIWEYKYDGTNWGASAVAPSSGNNITIQSTDSVYMNTGLALNSGKTITVNGKIELNTRVISGAGSFVLSSGASVYTGNANGLSGSLTITNVTRDAAANYVFNGTVAQSIISASNSIPATITGNLIIDNSAGVTLNAIRTINSPGKVTVKSGAKLYFGTGVGTSAYVMKGTGSFEAQSNATLVITNNYGIYEPATPTTADTLGSIRLSGTRTFASDINYIFSKNDPTTLSQSKTGGSFGTEITGVKSITFDNPYGSRLSSNITLNGTLNLVSGVLFTDANKITLSSTASLTKTDTSWVVGTLEKYTTTGSPSITYEVGPDSLTYTPVSLAFNTVSSAGAVAVSTTKAAHPNLSSSVLSSTKRLNYYINVNGAAVFTNYAATLTFTSSNVLGSANTSALIAGAYNSGWSYPSMGTRTSTSAQVNGIAGYGDIALGELNCTIAATPSSNSPVCNGNSIQLTGASSGGYGSVSYSWTGPASFASSAQSPSINPANSANAGVYTLTVTDSAGCQASSTTTVVVNQPTYNSESQTACETYTWHSTAYTVSGDYTYSYTNGNGCASVDTLHLTIINGTHNIESQTACETYTWHSTAYTVSGDYTYSYTNGNGCASVDTLHLTINNGTHNSESQTACGSFDWNGSIYTASGTYVYNYTNASGCASSDVLYLTINSPASTEFSASNCNSYSWNGNTYTASGDYTATLSTVAGCDSVVTLHLTILPGSTTSVSATACGSYVWYGNTYTASGTYSQTFTGASGCDSIINLSLTINAIPSLGSITGPIEVCSLIGSTTPSTYSVASVAGVSNYNWVVPTGVTIVSGQGSNSITVTFDNTLAATNQRITATPVSAQGCTGSAVNITLTKTIPAIPTAITGPTNICTYIGQATNAVYSCDSIGGASNYLWTVPAGGTIVSGQGTRTISVSFATFASGSVTVTAQSNCGNRAARSLTLTKLVPTVPVAITGPISACAYIGVNTQVSYSIAPVANATSYLWTVPAGMNVVSGQGTTTLVVTFSQGFATASLKVRSVANCGNSGDRTLAISGSTFSAPGPISGPTNACPYISSDAVAVYTIRKVANAPAYLWTVPAGVTVVSHPAGAGVNDTIIQVSFSTSFVVGSFISVQTTGCGTSTARTISIGGTLPSTPGVIAGPTNACEFMESPTRPNGNIATYTIRKVASATGYNWVAPVSATIIGHPAGTGANDTVVQVKYSSAFLSGVLKVNSSNACGTSSDRSLTISRLNPATPGIFDVVQTSACPNRVYTYTLAAMPSNATFVKWTVPAGAVIVSGDSTTMLTVFYPSSSIGGQVTAQSFNNCSSSSLRVLNIKLPACAASFASGGATTLKTEESVVLNDAILSPNPTTTSFSFSIKNGVNAKEKIKVRVMDARGVVVKTYNFSPASRFTFGSDLYPGNYWVEIVVGNEKVVKRVVKF